MGWLRTDGRSLLSTGRGFTCASTWLAGSGQAAVAIAKRYATVIAQDPSAEQLSAAQPQGANVSFQVAAAEATGQPDASFDLVTVAEALHWCGPILSPLLCFQALVG